MSTIRSEIENSSLVPVLQNGPKPHQSNLKSLIKYKRKKYVFPICIRAFLCQAGMFHIEEIGHYCSVLLHHLIQHNLETFTLFLKGPLL